MGMSKEEANRIVADEGWFYGLDSILKKVDVSKEAAAALKAGLFKLILAKVLEAKREVARLETAVSRVEAAARAGSVPKPADSHNSSSPDVVRLRSEMKALDGWTISLLESDISLLMAIETPTVASQHIRGLQRSFAELWALRVQSGYQMMKQFPEVFDRVFGR